MKITLVNPPYPQSAHSHPPFIPLGIGYLGAVCEKNGYDVNVIDCQAEKLDFDGFRKRIAQTDADVVGMTSTTLTYKSALENARIAKEELPE
jgi:anaerobic magnesium-protoporphyrin IX monomethyl ester cyclase